MRKEVAACSLVPVTFDNLEDGQIKACARDGNPVLIPGLQLTFLVLVYKVEDRIDKHLPTFRMLCFSWNDGYPAGRLDGKAGGDETNPSSVGRDPYSLVPILPQCDCVPGQSSLVYPVPAL